MQLCEDRTPPSKMEAYIQHVRTESKDRFGQAVEIELIAEEAKGFVYLQALWSMESRGEGVGTAVLQMICRLADQYQVPLELHVCFLRFGDCEEDSPELREKLDQLDDKGLNDDQLQRWYSKHGFVRKPWTDPLSIDMRREAQAPALQSKWTRDMSPRM